MTQPGVGQLDSIPDQDGPHPDRAGYDRASTVDGARPTFPEAPSFRAPSDPFVVSRPTSPPPPRPKASKIPALVTVVALCVGAGVIGGASYVASRPEPAPVAVSAPTIDPVALAGNGSEIGFTSAEGDGTLTIASHSWLTDAATGDPLLLVQLQIAATAGSVSVDPALVQVLDPLGQQAESRTPPAGYPVIASRSLGAGQSLSGWVAFRLAPGDATVLLSSPSGEAITALRVTG